MVSVSCVYVLLFASPDSSLRRLDCPPPLVCKCKTGQRRLLGGQPQPSSPLVPPPPSPPSEPSGPRLDFVRSNPFPPFVESYPGSQLLPAITPKENAVWPPVKLVYWGHLYGTNGDAYWSFGSQMQTISKCPVPCTLRSLNPTEGAELAAADGVVMFGSNFDASGVYAEAIARRPLGQSWLWHWSEATSNYPIQGRPDMAAYFNYTAGFSMDTDYPLIWNTVVTAERLAKVAPFSARVPNILCLYTNCGSKNGRENILKQLQVALPGSVHCMGPCGRNAPFPPDIGDHRVYDAKWQVQSGFWDKKHALQNRYRFDLVVQNSNCEGAVDEKVWDALANGAIPIYYGAWNLQDMLPKGYKMVIFLKDYLPNRLHELKALVDSINASEEKFNEYHRWHELVKRSPRGAYTLPAHRKRVLGRYVAEDAHALHLEFSCWFCQRIVADRIAKRTGKVAKPDASCCDGAVQAGCAKRDRYEAENPPGQPPQDRFQIGDGIYDEIFYTGGSSRVNDGRFAVN